MADDPNRGHSDTLYEEHEPTEKVDKVSFTLYGVPQAAEVTGVARPSVESRRVAQGVLQAAPGALPAASGSPHPADGERPVFVSMKPPSERSDKTEILPAIERPDMRPRLRPVTEPPARSPRPGTLGNYAPPRPRRKQSWLWLYVVLTVGAALAGAGVTLWLRSVW